jgi:DNA-binding helix-hairpin-helix protein with protein kinase domain
VRHGKLDQLRQNQRAIQLTAFLDQYEIQRAKIPGIGPGRKQTLQSYGIETAADLTKGIDPRELMRVKQEVLLERRRLEERFRLAFAELKQTHSQILAVREHMMPQVVAAQTAYLQAEADFKAARGSG